MLVNPHDEIMFLDEVRLLNTIHKKNHILLGAKPLVNTRLKKFLSYYRPYLGLFFADMTCAFAVSAITLILPLCTRDITKNVLNGIGPSTINQIYFMGIIMVVLVAIHSICNMFICYQGHMMGAKMESDMRIELFQHYQKLPFSFYDEQKTGQLMTRITNDLLSLTELFHHGPEDIIISFVKIIGAFIILMGIDTKLTFFIILFLPFMGVYAFHFNKKMNTALRASKDRIGDINAQVEDTLSGIRVVKSFANEEIEAKKFSYENSRFVQSRKEGYKSETFFHEGLLAFTQLMTIAVIIFGGINIAHASLDLADLLTYILFVGILIEPIQRLVNFATLYQEGITAFDRFMEMLEVKSDIQDSPNAINLSNIQGHIEFRNVSFRYRKDHNYVLKNLSLHIREKEFVALVGHSGVGKTTLCSLIPRFYETNDGEIRLDDIPIKNIGLSSLRRSIGIVQQDVYLFSGTVWDNICYGKVDARKEEIIEATKKANAHDFIMRLPDGYNTDIGQRGVKLSGGQKQRLSIARVFLKDPPIIIFDEATSSLDNESEKQIQDSLEKLSHNRTTIVIAHRLSTIRKAKRIIVLSDNGVINEEGTHDELITLGGSYANLYNI